MKNQTEIVTLNMPAAMHKKLCKLAEIAHCSPEWLVLDQLESDINQAFDEKDLDYLIPYVPYDTRDEAASAARAANAFQERAGNYQASEQAHEDDGKFHVEAKWEREAEAERLNEARKIIAPRIW